MSTNIPHNPSGRRVRAAVVPPVPFDIPAPDHDETAPTGRIIRRATPKRPFTAQDAIDVIRRMTLEARK